MERALFIFRNGDIDLLELDKRFFPLANLLKNIINSKYNGKKIKLINIKFMTQKTYEHYPKSIMFYTHFKMGVMWHNTLFDLHTFNGLERKEQYKYIWNDAIESIKKAALDTKNEELLNICDDIHKEGLERNLNSDYKLIEKNKILINNILVNASIWVYFHDKTMSSNLIIEKDGNVLYKQKIDEVDLGIEFFLKMYKNIESRENSIIIKGHKDVEYLPLEINLKHKHIQP